MSYHDRSNKEINYFLNKVFHDFDYKGDELDDLSMHNYLRYYKMLVHFIFQICLCI